MRESTSACSSADDVADSPCECGLDAQQALGSPTLFVRVLLKMKRALVIFARLYGRRKYCGLGKVS